MFYFIGALLIFNSCVDDDFDTPPADGTDPDITANTTIAELKALHTIGGLEEVKDDIIITGIVIADDRSGNFFRQLIIQDETGGIELRINETDLFNEYGIGRRVFVNCRTLWLGDYNGVTQLGAGTEPDDRGGVQLARIPAVLLPEFLVKGQWNQPVIPVVKSIAQLRNTDISTLVTVENSQFVLATCERTYARDYTTTQGTRVQESLNQDVESCDNGALMVVRTSGFANFASEMLPSGSGTITGVYSVFGSTKQLLIRNTDDVDMNGSRCGSSGVDGELKTIAEVRDMFSGSAQTISGNFKITGTVISDHINENISNRNMVIQDGDRGIIVRFSESHNFGIGEILDINIDGVELSEFRGALQLNNVEIERAFTSCTIGEVVPKEVTAQDIMNNAWDYQSTLVKINDAEISGNATFSGNTFVTDATGTVNMFTQSFAVFKDVFVPTGEVSITGIIGSFDGVQLAIRSLDDIEGGDFGGDATDEDISTIRALHVGTDINIPNNYQITGVVTSDITTGHFHEQNLVIQDGSAGIVVRFSEAHPFTIGTQLTIVVRGLELSEFNDLLQVNFVPLAAVIDEKPGTLPTPRTATVAEIKANGEAWESTLVKINAVTITGSSTFNGVTKVTDSTGELDMFTSAGASFSGDAVPSGMVNLTGFVSEYQGTRQIGIRDKSDLE